ARGWAADARAWQRLRADLAAIVAAIIPMVAVIVTPILAALMPLDAPPVLRRGVHAVRRHVARAPPTRATRPRRRCLPAPARGPVECLPPRVLGIPGPATIPAAPVVGGDKPDDGDAEGRDADVGQEDGVAAVVEADVLAEDPAAVVRPADVAPG